MALFTEKKAHNSKEAPKNGKTLLVDADTVAFHSILACTDEEIIMDRKFYSDEAWETLINEEGYNEHTNTCRNLNFDQAKVAWDYKLESLLIATGCEKAETYLTGWFPTFRHHILPEYKSDRKGGQRPLRLAEFKIWAILNRGAKIKPHLEADELVVQEYLRRPYETIIASVDKDLLSQVPGPKFDYYAKRFHNIDVSREDATYGFYKRLLTGDRGDFIITGLTRIGDKTAEKILSKVKVKYEKLMELLAAPLDDDEFASYQLELWKVVRATYIQHRNNRLHLMWACIGADYLVDDKIVFSSPPVIKGKCPYCAKDDTCDDHKLPEFPQTFEPLGGSGDTHLMTGIDAKKKLAFKIYKQYMKEPLAGKPELMDLEFFYLFVTGCFKKLDEVSLNDIESKYKELKVIEGTSS